MMPEARGTGGRDLLEVRDVALRFGGIIALDGVSFDLEEGQILGLIGPNGAGKTTLFNCLSRLYTPNRGDILFEGRSLLDRTASPRSVSPAPSRTSRFSRTSRYSTMCGSAATLAAAATSSATPCIYPGCGGRKRRSKRRSGDFSTYSCCATWRTICRRGCRSAPASVWSWRERSRRDRDCCCSTSRQVG